MSNRNTLGTHLLVVAVAGALLLLGSTTFAQDRGKSPDDSSLDQQLEAVLRDAGFTGRIESTLENRIGRHVDQQLADLGKRFAQVKAGEPITFDMFGQAIAEFEFTLTFANAPIDRFARGNRRASIRSWPRRSVSRMTSSANSWPSCAAAYWIHGPGQKTCASSCPALCRAAILYWCSNFPRGNTAWIR